MGCDRSTCGNEEPLEDCEQRLKQAEETLEKIGSVLRDFEYMSKYGIRCKLAEMLEAYEEGNSNGVG